MTALLRPPPDPWPLEDALRAGAPRRIGRALAGVEQHLREHYKAAHGSGGLLADGDRTRPALERHEDRLLDEMAHLLRRAGRLVRRFERGSAPDGDVRELVTGLRRLRDGEAALAQEAALGGDLGAGD